MPYLALPSQTLPGCVQRYHRKKLNLRLFTDLPGEISRHRSVR
jgi:hypothetical protein